jgi:hypothetical protein
LRRSLRQLLAPAADPLWMRYAGLAESGDELVYGHKD